MNFKLKFQEAKNYLKEQTINGAASIKDTLNKLVNNEDKIISWN